MWQIQNLLPRTVTAAQAREVARQSRGNPFWAIQVSATLGSADSQVPPLARTLTDRLSRSLSADAAAALAVVAAAGRIGLAEVLEVLEDLADPAAALDAAVLAGLVVETGNRLSAAHPLIGAAAVESLPPGRRAQLYRRLAAPQPTPSGTRTSPRWPPGRDRTRAVAAALDAAAAAAHARAANAAAAQFAVQAVTFTRRSRTPTLWCAAASGPAELLFLAGDMERSLEHLEALDIDRARDRRPRTGAAAADRHDRAWYAALPPPPPSSPAPSTPPVPIPGGERWSWRWPPTSGTASAAAAGRRRRGDQLRRGRRSRRRARPAPCPHQPGGRREVAAAEGLDTELLDRAASLEPGLPASLLHDTADLHRGVWSRYVDDLDTARAALRRSIARAREAGEDYALLDLPVLPGGDRGAGGRLRGSAAALADGGRGRRAGRTGRRPPGISSRAASC